MEGGIRTVQAGPPGQRTTTDTGPQQTTTTYQQRISSGQSPIHRPVDTPQSYAKGLLPSTPSSSTSSRSAASPLSPPRPGPGAPPTTYPPFPAREAPLRYVQQQQQQSPYSGVGIDRGGGGGPGIGANPGYRDIPYARVPPPQTEYRVSPGVVGPSQMPPTGPPPSISNSINCSSSSGPSSTSNSISGGGSISSNNNSSSNSSNMPTAAIGGGIQQQNPSSQQQQSAQQQQQPPPPPGSMVVDVARSGGGVIPPPSSVSVSNIRPRISLLPFEYNEYNRQQQQQQQDLGGPPASKKLRIGAENHHHPSHLSISAIQQQQQQQQQSSMAVVEPPSILKVDTRDPPGAYHPQVEAISPTLPPDPSEDLRTTKDELLQQISKVDSEIQKVEKEITMLKNKEATLKEASAKPVTAEEQTEVQPKHRSLAQIIYADNKRKANQAHSVLSKLGTPIELPLYNQPSDTDCCREIIQRHLTFKNRLLQYFQNMKSAQASKNSIFADTYAIKSQEWLRRVDKIEASAKRKAKEAKNREFFEKVFPELRKQREDKERFNRVGSRIKSEADLEEIMDGLQEQAMEDKKMRSYAVIPPLMLNNEQKRYVFHNENGLLTDLVADYKDRQNLNVWTTGEKEIFKEKYLQHPKNFSAIAVCLDRKSVPDCVKYYYLSKKAENYKQLLRKARQRTRSSRNPQKATQNQAQSIVDALTTGVTTRLQREQQQKTGGRDRAANSASNNNSSNTSTTINNNSVGSATTSSSSTSTTTTASSAAAANAGSGVSATGNNNSSTSGNQTVSTSLIGASGSNNGPSSSSSTSSSPTPVTGGGTTTTGQNSRKTPSPLDGNSVTLNHMTGALTTNAGEPSSNSITASLPASNDDKQSVTNCDIGNVDNREDVKDVKLLDAKDIKMEINDKTLSSNDVKMKNADHCDPSEYMRLKIFQSNDDMKPADPLRDKPYPCFVCKTENCLLTLPLEKGRGHLYGLTAESIIPPGARLCLTCHQKGKGGRTRYQNCPLPTCPNSKDRIKRFRSIPAKLYELAPEIREPIVQEFQIPLNVSKCCSACVTRIRRKITPHLQAITLSDDEVTKLKSSLQEHGPKWPKLEDILSKPGKSLRVFYLLNKKKYDLEAIVNDYYAKNPGEERVSITDAEESDLSTSSCDEREASSDTASAESPNNPISSGALIPKETILTPDSLMPPTGVKPFEDDRLMPPHGYLPKKQKVSEECDSSATETADEENESSPANRHSPKGQLQFGNQTTITMVPAGPQMQGGQHVNGASRENTPRNVRDVISNVIERGLKTPTTVPPPMKPAQGHPMMKTGDMSRGNDVTLIRDFNPNLKQPVRVNHTNPGDGLATLSVVNHHHMTSGHMMQNPGPPPNVVNSSQMMASHALQSQIAATITPVPKNQQRVGQPQQQPQSVQIISGDSNTKHENTITVYASSGAPRSNEQEPQTLDLSIKKRDSNVFPPPKSMQQNSGNSIYRNDDSVPPQLMPHMQHLQAQQNIPNSDNYQNFHPHDRLSKSPIYIPMGGINQQQQQQSIILARQQQQQQMVQQQQQQQQQHQSKLKVTPKLSPKMQHQQQIQSQGMGQMGAPKSGSITHGTPMNSIGSQPILVQGSTTLSPRIDGMLRQTPPESGSKIGSITQGTPLHLTPLHMQQQMEASKQQQGRGGGPQYDMYKNSRQSAVYQQQMGQGQPPQQPPPNSNNYGSGNYVRSPASFAHDQNPSQQLSCRQIITNDYLTSQQMHNVQRTGNVGGGGGRGEKESPSPRMNSAPPGNSQGMYYGEKERGGSRTDALSRSSPADIRGAPSPHRTPPPPPQRQGVIQRHNTMGGPPNPGSGGSKPPSPVPNRIHVMPNYLPPGHEALSSLVDVAVQQPSLPVPHKDDKRGLGPQASIQDQMQIAFHQQMRQQQMDMQRRQNQPALYREHTLEHYREMEQKHREQRDREHQAERERTMERERERSILAERDRNIQAQRDRNIQAGIERERERGAERERERIKMYDEQEERRRAISNLPQHFLREGQPRKMRGDEESFSAASLIDAIITHQITQSNSDSQPITRELPRPNYFQARDLHSSLSENNGKSHSPNVIKIDLDSDSAPSSAPSQHQNRQNPGLMKNITIGQLTDSIIAKDFGPKPFMPLRSPFGPHGLPPPLPQHATQESIMATEQWNRRMQQQQKEEQQHRQNAKDAVSNQQQQGGDVRRVSTPDERQIIRMVQTPSPRNKGMPVPIHEPVSPPDQAPSSRPPSQPHYYPGNQPSMSIQASQQERSSSAGNNNRNPLPPTSSAHQFTLDGYVKNRIVEAFSIEDENRGDDKFDRDQRGPPQQAGRMDKSPHHPQPPQKQGDHDDRSSTPRDMMDEEGISSSAGNRVGHGQFQNPPSTFPSSTYTYPYSALNVSGASSVTANHSLPPPMPTGNKQTINENNGPGERNVGTVSGPGANQAPVSNEPKPLLSAQYEELSDEE